MTAVQDTLLQQDALPAQEAAASARGRRLSLRWLLSGGILLATASALVIDIGVWAGQRFMPPPVSFIQGQAIFVAEMFYAAAYGLMGWLLATRLPRNPLGWVFQVLGVTMAAQMAITFLVQESHQAFRPLGLPLLIGAWAGSSLHVPSIVVLSAMIFALFPAGRALSPRWALGIWVTLAGGLLTMLAVGTAREGLLWYPSLYNPFAAPAALAPVLTWIGVVGLALLIAGVIVCAGSIGVRYRRTGDDERAQLRWIAIAVLLLAGAGIPFVVARYGLRMDYATGEVLLSVALAAGCFLPIAAAIAVLRHRLYDIDLIINRALVYIPLTGILGGLYAAGVAFFQRIFVTLTGNSSDAAIVITTLVLASLFTPVRNWLQAFVDRRFKPVSATPAGADPMQALTERVAALEARLAGPRPD